jgi:hypothetical protein
MLKLERQIIERLPNCLAPRVGKPGLVKGLAIFEYQIDRDCLERSHFASEGPRQLTSPIGVVVKEPHKDLVMDAPVIAPVAAVFERA